MMQAASKSQDPLRVLADTLRSKGGVEWRSAVMADQRVEFIRGKDLAAHFKAHPEQMQNYVSKGTPVESCTRFLLTVYMQQTNWFVLLAQHCGHTSRSRSWGS